MCSSSFCTFLQIQKWPAGFSFKLFLTALKRLFSNRKLWVFNIFQELNVCCSKCYMLLFHMWKHEWNSLKLQHAKTCISMQILVFCNTFCFYLLTWTDWICHSLIRSCVWFHFLSIQFHCRRRSKLPIILRRRCATASPKVSISKCARCPPLFEIFIWNATAHIHVQWIVPFKWIYRML